MGFLRNNQWCCSVTITQPGGFEAVIRLLRTDVYQLQVANDLDIDQWQVVRNHWVRGTLNLFSRRYMPTHFVVTKMEWLVPELQR